MLARIRAMDLHADLRQRALLHTSALDWMPSPMAGVERRMLDRRGDEVARATSIVRYGPGSVHRPWSESGCTIWVKTGHLPTTQGPDGSAG